MSQLTHFSRPIIRHLPSLNLVVRFDDSGISVRAYRCRKWKSVTWAQLASLADESEPVVRFVRLITVKSFEGDGSASTVGGGTK